MSFADFEVIKNTYLVSEEFEGFTFEMFLELDRESVQRIISIVTSYAKKSALNKAWNDEQERKQALRGNMNYNCTCISMKFQTV